MSFEKLKKNWFEILLITPLVVYILGFTLAPVIYAIYMSFQDKFTLHFPTLENYKYIFSHFQFKEAFLNTCFVTGVGITLELTIGLLVALILYRNFKGRGIFRAIMLLPLGVPTVVAATNMRYIFDTSGYLNSFLLKLGIIEHAVDWAGGGIRTLMTIVIADMWKVTPLVMLILLAGLETIPDELYEAAQIDGATAWKRFKHITLPLLKPAITMALVIRGIDIFRIFDLPLILVGRYTRVLSTYAYFEYYDYANPYTSSAGATILMVMILATIVAYLKITGTKEVQY